jgi:hypothetical protein
MTDGGSVDLLIACSCGRLRGTLRGVTPTAGNLCVCYCDDCQSFAHALGRAEEILDANGGTEIFQTFAGRLEFTAGQTQIACLRLTESGMYRWYARCCNTPIGNTPSSNYAPFVGLIRFCVKAQGEGGRSHDDALGPVRMRIFARYAKGERGGLDAEHGRSLAMGERVKAVLAEAMKGGEAGYGAFFDADSGAPLASPRVLSPEELRAIERTRDEI